MKQAFLFVCGSVGSCITYLLGGWDAAIITLLIFMLIDYISGLVVAGIFHKSKKTESGALSSKRCWQGLAKKCMTLVFVIVAARLDLLMETTFIRDAVCIAFVVNELISLIENAKLMGIPIPSVISKAIDVLNEKGGGFGNG